MSEETRIDFFTLVPRWVRWAFWVTIGLLVAGGILTMILLCMLLSSGQAHAQTASYGRYYVEGYNTEGYPQFQMVCDRRHCLGPHGKELGPPAEVAKGLPYVLSRDIERHNYTCWVLCRDTAGHIIGRPSPNWRNPYLQ